MNATARQTAWAIDANSSEGYGFLGRYWRFPGDPVTVGSGQVHKVRLFETRREARNALQDMKAGKYNPFPKAAVRRVVILTESIGENSHD